MMGLRGWSIVAGRRQRLIAVLHLKWGRDFLIRRASATDRLVP